MTQFLIWVLVLFGAAEATAVLRAGAPIRWAFSRIPILSELVECPMCLAYWFGVGLSYLWWSPTQYSPWIDGFAGTGAVLLLHYVVVTLGLFGDSDD